MALVSTMFIRHAADRCAQMPDGLAHSRLSATCALWRRGATPGPSARTPLVALMYEYGWDAFPGLRMLQRRAYAGMTDSIYFER